MSAGNDVGKAYLDLATDQLSHERAIRTSLEQRAMSVVTTSGALVTVLLSLAGLRTRLQKFVVPGQAVVVVLAAVVLLVAAAFAALIANRPARQDQINDDELGRMADSEWQAADYVDVLRKAIHVRCDLIASIRRANRRKTHALTAALLCETSALLSMAVAVFVVLA